VLDEQQRVSFHDIAIDDDFWFLQHYDHRRILHLSAKKVPIRVTQTTAAQKTMFMVFLNIRGAIFIN
jgi:hypothetical protein